MPLKTRISVAVITALTATADLSQPRSDLRWSTEEEWTDGTGAKQSTLFFQDRRTIAASATDTLDVNGGGLLTDLGSAFNITKLKCIGVKALTANAGAIALNRPAANGVPLFSAAGDEIVVLPGGLLLWESPDAGGVTVTAATGDLIAIVNKVASTANYEIVIVGS